MRYWRKMEERFHKFVEEGNSFEIYPFIFCPGAGTLIVTVRLAVVASDSTMIHPPACADLILQTSGWVTRLARVTGKSKWKSGRVELLNADDQFHRTGLGEARKAFVVTFRRSKVWN